MHPEQNPTNGTMSGIVVAGLLVLSIGGGAAFWTWNQANAVQDLAGQAMLEERGARITLLSVHLDKASRHIKEQEAELESLRKAVAAAEKTPTPVPAIDTAGAADRARLQSEKMELRRKLDRFEKREKEKKRIEMAKKYRRSNRLGRSLEVYQRRVLDDTWDLASRLAALDILRQHGARTPEAARSMMELLLGSATDPEMRTKILQGLRGLRYPEMIVGLLQMLTSESDNGVRLETIATLAYFNEDESVRGALGETMQYDDSAEVREGAATALAKGGD